MLPGKHPGIPDFVNVPEKNSLNKFSRRIFRGVSPHIFSFHFFVPSHWLSVRKREFRGQCPSRHFLRKSRGSRPNFLFANIAEKLTGPPLKFSMECLQNIAERLRLRAGVLRRSVFCLFAPLCKYPSPQISNNSNSASAPERRDRWHAGTGRGRSSGYLSSSNYLLSHSPRQRIHHHVIRGFRDFLILTHFPVSWTGRC